MELTYLDNSATTQVEEASANVAVEMMLQDFGNPSSLHYMGSKALDCLSVARHQVAQTLCCATDSVVFCSSGTMANNIAIDGCVKRGRKVVVSGGEHSSVLKPAESLRRKGFEVVVVPLSFGGKPCVEDILEAVDEDTALLSMMTVNNETGAVFPVEEITARVHAKNPSTLIHTDHVQGFGKIRFSVTEAGVDFATISGHKIHAPKGAAAIYIKDMDTMGHLFWGGSQERGMFPGTENVPAFCAFGDASFRRMSNMQEEHAHVSRLREYLLQCLSEIDGIVVNSPEDSIPHIVNISIPGHDSYGIVSSLSADNVFVSAGAACERGAASHVLKAMGLPDDMVGSALRISMSHANTKHDIDRFVGCLTKYI